MGAIEYLDPEIANEGFHAEKHNPNAWMDAPDAAAEEYQPDIEPPHINDYAAFKKHKHYRQYFRPHRYQPFPAVMYHATLGEKIVKTEPEALALVPQGWSPKPIKPRVDMTGKSLPVKSETQRLAETVANALAVSTNKGAGIDANAISAVVAAVMAAMAAKDASAPAPAPAGATEPAADAAQKADEKVERTALIELAEKEGIKIDQRWSNARLRKELGLD